MKLFHQKAPSGERRVFSFDILPNTLDTFTALPEAQLRTPYDTAALTVLALCQYPQNTECCFAMLNYLRGPRPMTEIDQAFIAERFQEKDYIPRSYFEGATPANHYQPDIPYTLIVEENLFTYHNEGFADVHIKSNGSEFPRSVQLRQAKDGRWFLWEQFLLADIRMIESADPWR